MAIHGSTVWALGPAEWAEPPGVAARRSASAPRRWCRRVLVAAFFVCCSWLLLSLVADPARAAEGDSSTCDGLPAVADGSQPAQAAEAGAASDTVAADCSAAAARGPGPLRVVPLSVGFQELLRMCIALGWKPKADASCESVATTEVRRNPANDAWGAAPETPIVLSPRAAARPAIAVP